ncbi:protealysin inhibitor emfourin [Microbacterium sp. 18062]|uniref:protealysin inhibitor emfourin n=1 Tax=Microbacterium sp. 18062 TaxID=2681410 RepID=UPI0013597DE7|nr:protealysin inhibitor emfourin [Microbacterium sp. 18062]
MSGTERAEGRVVVSVVRSGGIAGLRRRWRAAPPEAEAARWVALIDRCPWDASSPPARGADRYVWSIHARTPDGDCRRELTDAEMRGAWRELVDAVRAAEA